jgi:hypothetical protein
MDAGENFVIPLLTSVRDTECVLWLIGSFRGAGCVQRQGTKWGRGETRSAREEGYSGVRDAVHRLALANNCMEN